MKKRWFVVILTIGLLLHVLPLSVLALSPDPTITDSDGTILDWSDLSTVPYSLDDLQEQEPPVPDLSETGSEKSLADADNDEAPADDLPAGNPTPPKKTLDKGPGDDDLADADRDEATDDLPAGNPTPKTLDKESGGDDPADADRDKAAADDRPTVNLTPKTPDEESGGDDPADDDGSTTTPPVCKIDKIDDTYYYSTLDDAITAATDGDQIDLLKDIEWYTGLEFHSKNLTISGGNTYTLTLEQYGMFAEYSEITFKDLTLTIHAAQHTYEHSAGNTANLITHSSKLHLSHVEFSLTPDKILGSGIFLEDDSDLYFEDNTYAVIHDFKAEEASGIYAENYSKDGHGIWVTSSYLEVTDCDWNGMTIDPINLTLNNAGVYFTRNGTSGYGGLGCYGVGSFGGTLTMENSTLTSTGNYGGWNGYGIYVGVLDMDDASTLYATDNQGSGIGIGNSRGDESHICGQIYCEGNGSADIYGGSGGFVVHAQHDDHTYEGNVTIEPGAYLYACNNVGLAGVLNSWILNIESGATVIVDGNSQLGFANSYDARATIKSGANVSANHNDIGIYNYAGGGDQTKAKGFFLIEGDAHVTANNNATAGIYNTVENRSYGSTGKNYYTPENDYFTIEGGADISADDNGIYGICNDGGIFTIENGAIISTCHNGYDGIFNNKHGTFTMETGANVSVCNNSRHGIFNTNSGTFTVEENVDLQVEHNKNSGIVNNASATLTLLSGSVRYNTTSTWYGGGLRNYSTATLSDDVQLYNNHAEKGGDDIENGGTITFGPTGRGWELDGDPDCYDFITGWYDDYETTRWNAHGDEADLHMVLVAPVASYTGPLSLKAAHGSTGSLTVCKETVGELLPSDYDTVFTFELTLDDDAITTIDDKWCGVPFKNGKASFTLKSGESITLSNLPAGIGYTITETAQDGWTLLNLNPAETGVVPQNDTAKVVFTNLKNSPDDPYVPVVPVDPEIPEEPEGPETPEEPEGPETPEEPEEPEIPEETEETKETEETEAPGELPAEEPAQTDTSASLAQPEETPTQNTTTVTLIQTGTTDWLAAVLLIFGIGLLVCGWFFDRKQRAAKH